MIEGLLSPKIYMLLATAPLLLAANGAMSVESFLAKAEPLAKAGTFAVFNSDYRAVMAEMKSASQSYRAELASQAKAGQEPHSCPPEKVSMSSNEVLDLMRAVPIAERKTTSVRQAFANAMKKRFPCPAKKV